MGMGSDASDMAKRLARIQNTLRKELLEELQSNEADIENVFDPYSYSPIAHEIREKYLSRLCALQAIIQELAHFNQARRHPPVKLMSVRASDSNKLVELVNKKLERLNGARVIDVKCMQNKDDNHWVAVITYVANPFTETHDETAAWM